MEDGLSEAAEAVPKYKRFCFTILNTYKSLSTRGDTLFPRFSLV